MSAVRADATDVCSVPSASAISRWNALSSNSSASKVTEKVRRLSGLICFVTAATIEESSPPVR